LLALVTSRVTVASSAACGRVVGRERHQRAADGEPDLRGLRAALRLALAVAMRLALLGGGSGGRNGQQRTGRDQRAE
jgi:hypothetical protein